MSKAKKPSQQELEEENRRRRRLNQRSSSSPTVALSDWNQGRDAALGILGEAKAAVSPRGFSAASGDRAAVIDKVTRAMEAEPNAALPEAAKRSFYRDQDKVRADFLAFSQDADEYSGRRAGGNNVPEPAYRRRQAEEQVAAEREAEKAVQRQGLSAEDYWERNPTSKRTAVNSRGETVDVMDLARDYQQSQAERAEQESRIAGMREKGRQRRTEMENEQLQARLKEKGIPLEAASKGTEKTYLDELSGTKGTSTGFDANKARGLLSAATFQGWEDDKALTVRAEKLRQAEERKLRNLRSYEDNMGGRLNPEQAQQLADAIFDTEANIDDGKKNPGGLLTKGFWRAQAEENDAADAERRVAMLNIEKANQTTVKSLRENSKTLTEAIDMLQKSMENGELTEEQMRAIVPQLVASYS